VSDKPQVESNRLPASERYLRDPAFRNLVDVVEGLIWRAEYTPTELREAVILAAIHVNIRKPAAPVVLTRAQYDEFVKGGRGENHD